MNPIIWLKRMWYRHKVKKIGKAIPLKETERHMYLTGKTGSGKSSLLEQRIYYQWYASRKKQDICMIVLDPHGDMVDKVRRFDLAARYKDRLVIIDPFLRKSFTPCMNPFELEKKDTAHVELYTQQLVRVFEELIPDAKLSNYMRAILTPCLATLLLHGACDLTHLQQFMRKDSCQKWVELGKRSNIKTHQQFFHQEFGNRIYDMTKGSIYTKLQSLLNSSVFANMVLGVSTVNLDRCVRQGKIMLVNLSKGSMGEDVSETLGRLLIAQIKRIALSRANIPPHVRKPIYLVIDEADTFMGGDSMNVILKETRKYGLHLVLCTQNLVAGKGNSQLKRNVLSNTNVKVIGCNSMGNLKPLGQETNILLAELAHLKQHEFRIKCGDRKAEKLKTRNVLGGNSPLLLSKGDIRALNHRMVHKTQWYKPITPNHIQVEDWIYELPPDMHPDIRQQESPKPKFTV